ncbi:E3 ubiquitin ligase family protein [Saccharomonospora xinjiangensis]|uniref:E3 ubiquitin ligase family protein n=1 Tax=Saccharomonospora xinjiangensis TaxID=75294 RepID=UPI00106F3AFE|nr:E3 ubiquitin ligase family protein [Saccharomonospora xinjiangensis]QBQ58916.1 E3 Ubiquitin ligase [Saccharomonospora xinjiangensis]
MWIAGVVLLVVAVAAFLSMKHTRDQLHTMIGTETLSIPELEQYRAASDEVGASGMFRKTSEVVGEASPSPDGPLTAELSKAECVWYRYRIDRHYEVIEYRDGKRHRRKRTERVAEHTSRENYAIIDEQGRTINVDPDGITPDGAEQTVSRFEPRRGRQGGIDLFGIVLPALSGRGDTTIGYDYKEWVVRPGRRLYVLGEVHDRTGALTIGKPEGKGHFIISTRTEQELRDSRVRRHRLLAIGTVASALGGLGLLVAGLFT